jgi:hypothetical protein
VPFEEIAPIAERTPAATRKLASRARQRIQGADGVPDGDLARRREIVGAFLAASDTRGGQALDPDIRRREAERPELGGASETRAGAPGQAPARQPNGYMIGALAPGPPFRADEP